MIDIFSFIKKDVTKDEVEEWYYDIEGNKEWQYLFQYLAGKFAKIDESLTKIKEEEIAPKPPKVDMDQCPQAEIDIPLTSQPSLEHSEDHIKPKLEFKVGWIYKNGLGYDVLIYQRDDNLCWPIKGMVIDGWDSNMYSPKGDCRCYRYDKDNNFFPEGRHPQDLILERGTKWEIEE